MKTKLLEQAFETVAIMKVMHGWDNIATFRSLAEALKEETDKDIYSDDEKNELRRLYVLEAEKYM